MSQQKRLPADGVPKGGIRPFTPPYFFWMKFLEKEVDLQREFQWRVTSENGFIDWDFLPNQQRIRRLHKAVQYKIALGCVREAIEACADCANVNSPNLVEMIEYLTSLKELTDQILARRKQDIHIHDSLKTRIVESFSTKQPLKRHKEVYEIWVEISDAIVCTLKVLADERKRRRLIQIQQTQMQPTERYDTRPSQRTDNGDAEKDNGCVIL